jgi:hypothetical protein
MCGALMGWAGKEKGSAADLIGRVHAVSIRPYCMRKIVSFPDVTPF